MKKIIIPLVLIICLFMSSCQINNGDFYTETSKPSATHAHEITPVYIKGIWISFYDHISAADKTADEYKAETDEMFKLLNECGFNTAFVHLRAFSDAFYKSEIYPYSKYIAGKEGNELNFDPFAIMLESAKQYNVSVHGWINPFRISASNDPDLLSDKNPAKEIIKTQKSNNQICVLENGIYYNPSYTENHKIIIDGVKEIIDKYDIDGIHIDDYFYPSTDEKIDSKQYSEYVSGGGSLNLSEWRKTNINTFVSSLYSAVKLKNNELIFSISPSAKIEDNEEKHYADCSLWLSKNGYADLIIPQIYYGFEHETLPFEKTLFQWSDLPKENNINLACGIAAYKYGETDIYAGSGKTEWEQNNNIIFEQLEAIKNNSIYSGYVLFSYSDLLNEEIKKQIVNFNES